MSQPSSIRVETLTVGPIAANCYVLFSEAAKQILIVDPGDEPDTIMESVKRYGPHPVTIWLTHGHIDHIGGAAAVQRATKAPVYIHASEADLLTSETLSGAKWLGLPFEPLTASNFFEDNQVLPMLGRDWRMIHVPGHSPGSIMMYSAQDSIAIGGDLIFRSSVGRTDLPGGDSRVISQSIRRVYNELPHETRLYPGHGPDTTLDVEKSANPYVKLILGNGTL
jgi:hydroxyacylglutathione hydrolase